MLNFDILKKDLGTVLLTVLLTLVAFTYWDIRQHVYYSCLFPRF